MLLAIDDLKVEANQHGRDAETCEHDERPSVVQLVRRSAGGVGAGQHIADQDREEPQSNVLDPEDQGISGAEDLLIDELRDGRPQSRGDQREAGSEHQDRDIGDDGSADSATLEQR